VGVRHLLTSRGSWGGLLVLSSFRRRSPHEAPPREGLPRTEDCWLSPGWRWADDGAQEQVDRDTPVSITPTGEEGDLSTFGGRGSFMVTRTSPTVGNLLTSKWTSGYIFVYTCLGYLYTRVYFFVIAIDLEVIYILFITYEIYILYYLA
jgi:hypothetical protein